MYDRDQLFIDGKWTAPESDSVITVVSSETMNVFGNTISANMLCVPRSREIGDMGLREITSPDDQWRSGA